MGRLPPRTVSSYAGRTHGAAYDDTAHPIVNFDTTDRLTLERFASRAGRADYVSSARACRSVGGAENAKMQAGKRNELSEEMPTGE